MWLLPFQKQMCVFATSMVFLLKMGDSPSLVDDSLDLYICVCNTKIILHLFSFCVVPFFLSVTDPTSVGSFVMRFLFLYVAEWFFL